MMEARTFLNTQHAGHSSNYSSDRATDNGSDRTGRPFALTRATFDAAGHALS
jgi:hypothetical protein